MAFKTATIDAVSELLTKLSEKPNGLRLLAEGFSRRELGLHPEVTFITLGAAAGIAMMCERAWGSPTETGEELLRLSVDAFKDGLKGEMS